VCTPDTGRAHGASYLLSRSQLGHLRPALKNNHSTSECPYLIAEYTAVFAAEVNSDALREAKAKHASRMRQGHAVCAHWSKHNKFDSKIGGTMQPQLSALQL